MTPRLPRLAGWLLTALVPSAWRDSIAGDLLEERDRRRRNRRHAGGLWAAVAALRIAAGLALDRRRALVGEADNVSRRLSMDGLRMDLHQALKSLRSQRLYAAVAIAILAIGIGANAAVFNLMNWLILRPVPGVTRPDELITITATGKTSAFFAPVSVPDYEALRKGLSGLSGLAAYQSNSMHVAAPPATPRRVEAEVVSGNFLDVLGAAIAAGRGFTVDEGGSPAALPAIVISDRLWRADFAGRADIIGQTLVVNGKPTTIVGVAVAGFHGARLTGDADLWVPIAQHAIALPMYKAPILTSRRATPFFGLVGRRAPGTTIQQLESQADAVHAGLLAAFPDDTRLGRLRFAVSAGTESRPWVRNRLASAMTLLMGLVALLLALTAANVGNLMLARAKQREDELATRLAIGATRARLARLLIVESAVLSLAAGAVALGITTAVSRLLEGTVVLQGLPPMARAAIDWRVLAFAIAVSMAISIAAGLIPALAGTRVDLASTLRAAGRSQSPRRRRLRQALTAAQIAVSLTLLVGALLLTRSMLSRLTTNVGFEAGGVLAFSVEPGLQGYGPRQEVFYRQLIDAVRQVPGVRASGLAWLQPFSQGAADTNFKIADAPGDQKFSANSNMVSPGFFAAIGLPLVDGRDFTELEFQRTDDGGRGVVILTESLARRAFPAGSAVGRRIVVPDDRVRTVVGVVGDTKLQRVAAAESDMVFEPFGQTFPTGWASMLVKIDGADAEVVPRLRQTVAAIDPALPIYDVTRLDAAIARQFADDILVARLTMAFALIATLIAAVGLYGVLTRGVAERHREFGIRAALGAAPARVARLVTTEAALVLATGLAAGVGLSAALSRVIASRLSGVTAADPWSYAAAAAVLAVATTVAAWPAARRAARIGASGVLR